jgi:glutathione S-transferase
MSIYNDIPLYSFRSFAEKHYKDATWSFPKNTICVFEHSAQHKDGFGSTTSVNTRATFNHCLEQASDLFGDYKIIRVNVDIGPAADQATEAFSKLNPGGGVPLLVVQGRGNDIFKLTEDRGITTYLSKLLERKMGKTDEWFVGNSPEEAAIIDSLCSRTIQDHTLGNPSNRTATRTIPTNAFPSEALTVAGKKAIAKAELEKLRDDKLAYLKNCESILAANPNMDFSETIAGTRVAANIQNVLRFNDTGPRGSRGAALGENAEQVPPIDLQRDYPLVTALVEKVVAMQVFKDAMHGEHQPVVKEYLGEFSSIQTSRNSPRSAQL